MDNSVSTILTDLKTANVSRVRYLLQNYKKYSSVSSDKIDKETSRAVMKIVSMYVSDNPEYSEKDQQILDSCGYLLLPAINDALESIKALPPIVIYKVYPILYHKYFNPDGPSIDMQQLVARLKSEDINLTHGELEEALKAGERIMASILFNSSIYSALSAYSAA